MDDDAIDAVIEQIRAVRDTEAVRNLCMDLYVLRDDYDTQTAVEHAKDLLACVRQYQFLEDFHRKPLLPRN